jgi:hypothetical protein
MTAAQARSKLRIFETEDTKEALVTPVGYLLTDLEQKWRDPIIKRLNELVALQPGWDGYYGVPVTFENAYFAMEVLDACCRGNDPIPQIVPGTSGDLQIEWHLEKGDIELHILSPNNVQAWHVNENIGTDGEEVLLTTDFTAVVRWIENLTEPTRATVAPSS